MTGLMIARAAQGKEAPVLFGQLRSFDGTFHRYGSDAEDHVKGLLAREPDSAFLWARHVPKQLRRNIIHGAIRSLLATHDHSNRAFELFPEFDPPDLSGLPKDKPLIVDVRSFDLSTEKGMAGFCDGFLGEPHSPGPRQFDRRPSRQPAPTRPTTPIQEHFALPRASQPIPTLQPHGGRAPRNAPCPCGSGHKYKKCCGR